MSEKFDEEIKSLSLGEEIKDPIYPESGNSFRRVHGGYIIVESNTESIVFIPFLGFYEEDS